MLRASHHTVPLPPGSPQLLPPTAVDSDGDHFGHCENMGHSRRLE